MRHYLLFKSVLLFGLNSIASINMGFVKATVDFNINNQSIIFEYRDFCLTNAVSA
jgi:hypothetical protein